MGRSKILGTVTAAALLVLVVFWVVRARDGGQQPPAAVATPPRPSATPAQVAPTAPGQDMAAAPSPTAAADPSSGVSPTSADPLNAGTFVVNSVQDGLKALDLAIEDAGGATALAALERATWRHFMVGRGLSLSGVIESQGDDVMRSVDEEGGTETWLKGATCRTRHDAVVAPCPNRAVATANALRSLNEMARLLPLTRAPWKLVSAAGASVAGRLLNALSFARGGMAPTAVLYLDPSNQRPQRVDLVPAQGCCAVRFEFDDFRTFAGARFGATRRVFLQGDSGDWLELTDRLIDVTHGADAAHLRMPPPTQAAATQISARLPELALEVLAGHHAALPEKELELSRLFESNRVVWQARLCEQLGPAGDTTSLDSDVRVQAVLRRAGAVDTPALRSKQVQIAAEPSVASQVARVPIADVLKRVAAFCRELGSQGHRFAATSGPRICYDSDPDPETTEITIEIQVPLQAE